MADSKSLAAQDQALSGVTVLCTGARHSLCTGTSVSYRSIQLGEVGEEESVAETWKSGANLIGTSTHPGKKIMFLVCFSSYYHKQLHSIILIELNCLAVITDYSRTSCCNHCKLPPLLSE